MQSSLFRQKEMQTLLLLRKLQNRLSQKYQCHWRRVEDTNVLVILSFLLTRKGRHLIFTTDTIGKGIGNHATQRDLLNSLENLDKISFCTPYSLTGCDSISRLFGIGRPVAIIKLLQNSILRKDNRLFSTKKTLHLNQSQQLWTNHWSFSMEVK